MLTVEQNARLTELSSKMTAGTALSDAEVTELMALMNAQAAGIRAVKEAAVKTGIVLASDKDSEAIAQLAENFFWQFEGNLSWFAYRMEVIASEYNTLAGKLKWPICTDIADLPALITGIPTMYQSSVQSGQRKAAVRYSSQWSKELGKLALLRSTGKTVGTRKGIKP